MLARKQKTNSIFDDEIDEDNIVFEHKSVDAFEQDNITTMALGTWGCVGRVRVICLTENLNPCVPIIVCHMLIV